MFAKKIIERDYPRLDKPHSMEFTLTLVKLARRVLQISLSTYLKVIIIIPLVPIPTQLQRATCFLRETTFTLYTTTRPIWKRYISSELPHRESFQHFILHKLMLPFRCTFRRLAHVDYRKLQIRVLSSSTKNRQGITLSKN